MTPGRGHLGRPGDLSCGGGVCAGSTCQGSRTKNRLTVVASSISLWSWIPGPETGDPQLRDLPAGVRVGLSRVEWAWTASGGNTSTPCDSVSQPSALWFASTTYACGQWSPAEWYMTGATA